MKKQTDKDVIKGPWKPPADQPMPPLPQDRPSCGNQTLLVLVDSSCPSFRDVHATVIAALHHMGLPYQVWDLAGKSLPQSVAENHAGLLIAQEHLGRSFSRETGQALINALGKGTGLCSLDPWIGNYPELVRKTLELREGHAARVDCLTVPTNDHFISTFRDAGEKIRLRMPAAVQSLPGKGISLLNDIKGRPLLRVGSVSGGRFAWWGIAPQVWLPEVLGHAWGLDDFFWRAIVWTARKPFVMKAMPPMATMRFDDCAGFGGLMWKLGQQAFSGNPLPVQLGRILNLQFGGTASVLHGLNYVHILNEFGWRPEIGLFVDQISEQDWEEIKKIYDRKGAQLSAHSFADGFDTQGRWYSHFISHKGLEVKTRNGTEFVYSMEKNQPYRFVCWSNRVLDQNFKKLDRLWKQRGIRPGRVTNMHWRNPPSNALPFYLSRGQAYNATCARYNHALVDPKARQWRLLPYQNPGMRMDYMPIPEDAPPRIKTSSIFTIGAHIIPPNNLPPRPGKYGQAEYGELFQDNVDFCRAVKPLMAGLSTHRDLDLIARTIIRHSKLGLQSLFFACPLTHEMNLATLTCGEWREILTAVEKGLSRHPRQNALYDEIALTARSKCETHIRRAEFDGRKVKISLDGKTQTDLPLYVFRNRGETCTQQILRVPSFRGHSIVRV